MAEGFHTLQDEETLRTVFALAESSKKTPKAKGGGLHLSFVQLIEQIVRYATGEDSNWDEPQRLLDRALEAWKAGETRKAGVSLITLNHLDTDDWRQSRLVLEIVTDDKPFVVDSISAALADAGKPVSFFLNAVIDTTRDATGKRAADINDGEAVRESMIYAEMEPPVEAGEIETLKADLETVLADVSLAVTDWEPMRARLGACIAQLERARPKDVDREDLRESVDFLKWLWDNRFAFLGVRRFSYSDKNGAIAFAKAPDSDLGILKDNTKRVLKATYTEDGTPSAAVVDFMSSGEPVIIAKANTRSTVHRRVHMDYIGVKVYGIDGKVIGEERFVGLFTADAYNRPASDIPLLRSKVRKVVEHTGFTPGGHNEKALLNILETFPRDEIFQADIDALRENALGILRLYKRPRAKLFLRRDRFDRFVSALVFIPRDRFSSSIRAEIGNLLASTYDGHVAAFNPYFGDAALVRVHFIIGIKPGAPEGPGLTELTRRLRAIIKNWSDDLLEELRTKGTGSASTKLFGKYENAFDAAYMHRTSAAEALADIGVLEKMDGNVLRERVFRPANAGEASVGIKLYRRGGPLDLSNLIPRLENLGLHVIQEAGYEARVNSGDDGAEPYWIHDFHAEEKNSRSIDISAIQKPLEETLCAIMAGKTEDDGFNALVTLAGLHWREAWILRAAAKYAMQTAFPFSQAYIEEALAAHPEIARSLIAVFHARFNPSGPSSADDREKEVDRAEQYVQGLLDDVQSLDEDRIIRRFLNIFAAVTRTNYYQRRNDGGYKPYISFKIDSQRLAEIPEPKPFREIFVSGPRVDGVHLRFGPVSRGGLRWSDRREDFRTEVLGLVKAQRVKNAVIVPSGSKGGFYPKQLPVGGDRNAIFEEGRDAYKEFISGLLDVTDNIVGGKTVTPKNIVRWDDQDPYLVVAADKGTATFSDTANGISLDYDFWLGDAFASGGSAGYDHKAMGITARGAWEAVKRHFREMGKDIQSEPFTVAGVGDMSGDVFGNGMLLSKQIRLVAAFDHRDVFIDPDPDPATSWDERKRLFDMQRSSWADYDKKLISKGGGVFSRASKSIAVTPEIKALLGLKAAKVTPNELIQAILKAPTELFWLGGIGTYFKSPLEENWRVGDRANDAIRINADEMTMNVIGEGANLGLTQKARILFARQGGRINTDAIDNSAGVDSSDHEVNIKILVSTAIEKGELKSDDRDDLLKEMTEDVAAHVLRHNQDQTRGISLMEKSAASELGNHTRLMASLEAEGRLDRALEDLPDDKVIAALRSSGQGLSRPELSVLLAYAKMKLFDELVASSAPDDPALEGELFDYFPAQLHQFNHAMVKHRLRREIIATRISNEIVDTCGAAFAHRVVQATGAPYADLALAYEAARQILQLGNFAAGIDALDNAVSADTQNDLYATASQLLSEQVYKILVDAFAFSLLERKGVKGLIDQYRQPMDDLKDALPSILSASAAKALKDRTADWRKASTPEGLAGDAGLMPSLEFAFDIVNLARQTGWASAHAGAIFFEVGDRMRIDAVRDAAKTTGVDDHYDRLAMRRAIEELAKAQAGLAQAIIGESDETSITKEPDWVGKAVDDWWTRHEQSAGQAQSFIADLDLSNGVSVAKLALMAGKLTELVSRVQMK